MAACASLDRQLTAVVVMPFDFETERSQASGGDADVDLIKEPEEHEAFMS
jgi:hypothetical protein